MKKLLAILLCAVMLLGLAACGEKQGEASGTTGGAAVSFTVIVVHKDGSEKTFTYETNEEFVGPVLTEAGLLKGNAGPYGLEITEVDGEKAVYSEDGAYWAVYEGEEYALQGIDTTPVKEGQVYKLVWTKA